MTTKILRAENLIYKVNGFELSIENFVINKGEKICLFGPNGSGKTTLAKLLTGYLKPLRGKIILYDKKLEEWSDQKRSEKITYASFDLFLAASGKKLIDFVRLGAFRRKNPTDVENEIKKLFMLFGLSGKENQPLDTLSAGELQKAIIAQTLMQRPKIVLLDEPTAHLDIYWQTAVIKNIFAYGSEFQEAVVIILHDLNLALNYFDRLLCLKDGKLLLDLNLSDWKSRKEAALRIGNLYNVKIEVMAFNDKIVAVYY
jgi:iron complex transport system ATP-binding protein